MASVSLASIDVTNEVSATEPDLDTCPFDADLMAAMEAAHQRGFIGSSALSQQLRHAVAHGEAAGLDELPDNACVLDLGSGGGIPGIVLARRHHRLRFTLLDRSAKRCSFLREVVERLKLGVSDAPATNHPRVRVAEGEAAELAHDHDQRHAHDVVLARAFGPPAVTAECAAGFLAANGKLVVSEPPESSSTRWPPEPLAELGLELAQLVPGPPRAAVLVANRRCPGQYPRPWKKITKQPLY